MIFFGKEKNSKNECDLYGWIKKDFLYRIWIWMGWKLFKCVFCCRIVFRELILYI